MYSTKPFVDDRRYHINRLLGRDKGLEVRISNNFNDDVVGWWQCNVRRANSLVLRLGSQYVPDDDGPLQGRVEHLKIHLRTMSFSLANEANLGLYKDLLFKIPGHASINLDAIRDMHTLMWNYILVDSSELWEKIYHSESFVEA